MASGSTIQSEARSRCMVNCLERGIPPNGGHSARSMSRLQFPCQDGYQIECPHNMAHVCSLQEAVADSVHDGSVVAMEGFTHLIPFAAGHEVIRQRRRNLTLVRMTPDIIYDQ